ncbi:MAG: hypothetical protein ACK5JR_02210 [Tropicimonas sp.]|uniref:hypothetical protein n=1 Tax=Tropicimonas sp. TaxID=2067044 RepID=UPI003A87CB91
MKTSGWLAIAAALFAAAVAYDGRRDLLALPQTREWSARPADGENGTLAGVNLRVVFARAAPLPEQPDSAVLLVRLALSGPQAARKAWLDCSATLIGPDGSRWLPVTGFYDAGARLAPDGQSNLACMPMPFNEPPEGGEILSDQAYMVPVSLLGDLTLRVSAQGTRPEALDFALAPLMQPGF